MQFEVAAHRLESEFTVPVTIERLPLSLARRTIADHAPALREITGVEIFTRARDGAVLAAFPNRWRLQSVRSDNPDLVLEPLLAGADSD